MRKILLCLLALGFSGLLIAHEFWLAPERFLYQRGESMKLSLLVGEDFDGTNWSGSAKRVQSLKLFYEGGEESLVARMDTSTGAGIILPLQREGTQVIAFNSTNSHIRLDAKTFNEYLQEDQLTEAIRYRQEQGQTDSAGTEFYQRSVKTIFQVGPVYHNVAAKETGLPLDLLPLQNPYQLEDGDSLSIRVLFRGKPLAGQYIRLWHRNREIYLKLAYRTNAAGEVRFPVMKTGNWMVSTVKMIRRPQSDSADWQSYWGSLTWGYR